MAFRIRSRAAVGSTGARAARHAGYVPGVLFGHGGAPLSIQVEARALGELLQQGGQSHVVEASIDGGPAESVLLRELQRDPITRRPLSADFQRVSTTEAIATSLPVVTVGAARGVRDEGGLMDVVTHALEVRGPAGQIPERLEVDVTALGVGQHLSAGDVVLPAGFTLLTPHETIVVVIEGARASDAGAGGPGSEAPVPGTASGG